jgi:hypothetical protein
MNWKFFVAVAAISSWTTVVAAQPGSGLTGNDTGGIITWSPEHQRVAFQWAAEHCARYGEYARITSIHPWYGDYIAFACDWRPFYRHPQRH